MSGTIRITSKGASSLQWKQLTPLQRNLKTLSSQNYQRIRKEILEFGFAEPIAVWHDRENNQMYVLNGHQRLTAIKKMVEEEGFSCPALPVSWVEAGNLSDANKIVAALASQYGTVTPKGLQDFMVHAEISMKEVRDSFNFPEINMKHFERDYFPNDGEEDPPTPPPPVNPISKLGDMWQLGKHRIMCGDATKPDHVRALMNGQMADFLFTSPPYNVGVDYTSHDDKTVEWAEYSSFLKKSVACAIDILAPGRAFAWNVGVSPKTHPLDQLMMMQELGLTYFRMFIWAKVGVPIPSWFHTMKDPRARRLTSNYSHEFVAVFSKGDLEIGSEVKIDDTLENDVFRISQTMATRDLAEGHGGKTGAKSNLDRSSKTHPAPFPVKLPKSFIQHMTGPDEIVYEPFCGAGSTVIAAEKLGRRCYGMDIDPAYVDVSVKRWEDMTGQKALRAGGFTAKGFEFRDAHSIS